MSLIRPSVHGIRAWSTAQADRDSCRCSHTELGAHHVVYDVITACDRKRLKWLHTRTGKHARWVTYRALTNQAYRWAITQRLRATATYSIHSQPLRLGHVLVEMGNLKEVFDVCSISHRRNRVAYTPCTYPHWTEPISLTSALFLAVESFRWFSIISSGRWSETTFLRNVARHRLGKGTWSPVLNIISPQAQKTQPILHYNAHQIRWQTLSQCNIQRISWKCEKSSDEQNCLCIVFLF